MKKSVNLVVCSILALIFCLCMVSCKKAPAESELWESALYTEDTELGSGSKTIEVEVKAGEKSVTFTINTDKDTVGDALTEHRLISGEKGPYGLYVKRVNGITADYEKTETYWSFCKNGEEMQTGVDTTEISDGEHYELIYTK